MTAPRAALPRAGLGPYAESFIRLNETVLSALGAHLKVFASSNGAVVRVVPGARVGAVPSRSAQTGHVAGGFIVKPHFDWAGMGRVLVETRWATSPELLDLPLVPGSGREVPPWVLAGPVLARIEALVRSLKRGHRAEGTVLSHPRGRIVWPSHVGQSMGTAAGAAARGHTPRDRGLRLTSGGTGARRWAGTGRPTLGS
jgi:hypothetical protein